MRVLKILLAWLAAVVTAAGLGSIVQTQFNLAAIATLNGPVKPRLRLETTWLDLHGFAPGYALVVGAAFLVAWPVAAALVRLRPSWRAGMYLLAGGIGVYAALAVMNAVFPVTVIGASRGVAGTACLSAAGAAGGWVFARLTGRLASTGAAGAR